MNGWAKRPEHSEQTLDRVIQDMNGDLRRKGGYPGRAREGGTRGMDAISGPAMEGVTQNTDATFVWVSDAGPPTFPPVESVALCRCRPCIRRRCELLE